MKSETRPFTQAEDLAVRFLVNQFQGMRVLSAGATPTADGVDVIIRLARSELTIRRKETK